MNRKLTKDEIQISKKYIGSKKQSRISERIKEQYIKTMKQKFPSI